jgi:hypothetical protein
MFKYAAGLMMALGMTGMIALTGCGGGEGTSGAGGAGSGTTTTGSANPTTGSGNPTTGTGGASTLSCNDICAKVSAAGCLEAPDCAAFCAAASGDCRACIAKSAAICNPVECTAVCMGGATSGGSTSGGSDCTANGMACMFDADCSNKGTCNSATTHCFDPNAVCLGTPCGFDSDCAIGEKCNSATLTCVMN